METFLFLPTSAYVNGVAHSTFVLQFSFRNKQFVFQFYKITDGKTICLGWAIPMVPSTPELDDGRRDLDEILVLELMLV